VTYAVTIERERGERVLERVRTQLASGRTPPRSRSSILVGRPGATIAEAALEWNAQFIILGLGRHGTLGRLVAGDTVARVLRHATVPVVAVPFRHAALPRRGVVAVDFGLPSLTAMRRAAQLIGAGAMHVVHVRPEIDIPATDPDAWSQVYQLGVEALTRKLTADLEVEFPEIHVKTAFLRGHASTQLLEYAERVDADLIAVGQHGHGVVDRFLFGSVAQEVVRSARSAVLVTPPTRTAE
jgi:nucleotide-binding universal stress UspA family protein